MMSSVLAQRRLTVIAWNQIVPQYVLMRSELQLDPDAYHEYRMVYSPQSASADIFVDGTLRIRGYRGENQFQEGLNIDYGAERFNSAEGRAAFKLVRFQIAD